MTKQDNIGLFHCFQWKTQHIHNIPGTAWVVVAVSQESRFLAKPWNSCSLQEVRACSTCDDRPLGLFAHT